jgi:hypothetical protein
MTDVSLGTAQPRRAARHASAEEPVTDIPPDLSGVQMPLPLEETKPPKPVNPYAPTGWQTKQRIEFDAELPSGQMCRLMRLERDDLFRLNLMDYLDTFTPMLMSDDMTPEEREGKVKETMQKDPEALMKMLQAIDQVVMSATLKPRITDDPALVNYGTENDWDDPNFVAIVPLENVSTMERMFIFGAVFGRSMDELKSVWEQAEGLGGVADNAGVQQESQ